MVATTVVSQFEKLAQRAIVHQRLRDDHPEEG
jgi:hypothetical protein